MFVLMWPLKLFLTRKEEKIIVDYRVYLEFWRNLGKSSKIIIFVSLLTTLESEQKRLLKW